MSAAIPLLPHLPSWSLHVQLAFVHYLLTVTQIFTLEIYVTKTELSYQTWSSYWPGPHCQHKRSASDWNGVQHTSKMLHTLTDRVGFACFTTAMQELDSACMLKPCSSSDNARVNRMNKANMVNANASRPVLYTPSVCKWHIYKNSTTPPPLFSLLYFLKENK